MRIFFIIMLILLSFSGLKGQERFNLKDCLEVGLKQNYQIRIVKNEQQISDNNVTPGNAGYLPTLSLDAGYTGTANDIEQRQTSGETSKYNNVNNQNLNAGVNLNWTVFDGFNIQTNYERLKELQQMGKLNTRLSIEDFISKLAAEYYNYIRQNIRLGNLRYAVELSKERVRIVEARYNIGSMSRLDLQQARVDFNADSSNLIKQYEILHVSRISLNKMMALDDIEYPLFLKDSIISFNASLIKENLWTKTEESNTELLLSAKNKTLSQINLKNIQSRNYPYLKLNAGYGYTQYLPENASYDRQQTLGLNYGLTLGFNIFDGFNRRREQKNAKIQIENRELEYMQLELSLKSDFSNIWMAYQNNLELTELERENLETAKENYEIAIERYKLGELSGIELREAQNSLLEAEERLLQAEYNTKLCEISLMQISGQATGYLNN